MHVAAASPQWTAIDGIDPAALDRERAVLTEQARASGRPENIIGKMVEGRLRKFYEDTVLLEQTFVIDGESKVSKAVEALAGEIGAPVSVAGFQRFALGEGNREEGSGLRRRGRRDGGRLRERGDRQGTGELVTFRRILLKLSGEALMGSGQYGLDPDTVERIALEIRSVAGSVSSSASSSAAATSSAGSPGPRSAWNRRRPTISACWRP